MTYAAACLLTLLQFSISSLYATDLRHEKQPVSFDQMAKVPLFAFGGIGFASVTTEGEIGFNEILSRPTAAAEFEKLFSTGNPQAKCYALVGLHRLNPKRFESLATPLESSRKRVSTGHGCILFQDSIASIVKQIREGAYSARPIAQGQATPGPK